MVIKKVNSFGEYVLAVAEVAKSDDKSSGKTQPEVLWFRGQSQKRFDLIPSLYRVNGIFDDNDIGTKYTKRHYAEDIRVQNYIAKNYHYYDKLPTSRVQWLEVMQHHEMKTRVLDWSESSIHSVLFALEPFLDHKKYTTDTRRHQSPCVWVLKPQKLNRELFKCLLNNTDLCEELSGELHFKKELLDETIKKTGRQLENFIKMGDEGKDVWHIQEIINLSAINDELNRDRFRIRTMIEKEEFFPLFYFLSRVYSDGYLLKDRLLCPLAVVEPYHSERIRSQRGVFTVFPHYKEKDGDNSLRKLGIDPNAMQRNDIAKDALMLIELERPENIAYELLSNGIQPSWLYPELPIVASELEGHRIFD